MGIANLVQVGYWAPRPQDCDPAQGLVRAILEVVLPSTRTPRVEDFIDPAWDALERARMVEYLQRGRRLEAYMGCSTCRICGQDNGCLDLTDGVYVWPDGLVHYVRDHAVKPPQAFVDHAAARLRR